MKKLKVLMLTRLFPSTACPILGTFCLERAKALAAHADVRVMVPVPYFPRWVPAPQKWRLWSTVERARELEGAIRITYPRYFSMPKVATFSQGLAMAYSAWCEFQHQYKNWRPDIIDGQFAFPDGYAAVRLGQTIGCSAVVTCLGADLRVYSGHAFVGTMLRWTLRTAARVIAVSADLKRLSIAQGCPEENTVFLTHGVDLKKFALRAKSECRARLGLPQDRKIGVYVGYLIDRKNQSLVIQAVDDIRKRGCTPPLITLIGDGPNRKRLEREIAELGLGEHVLLAGQVTHEEVALWMGAADWLLLSSDYEGWATVYFEAMACGRPVLTSNVNSAKDAICKPEYGYVVEPVTPEAFANALLEASGREYDAQLLRTYAEEHSWTRWAEQAMAVFEDVVTRQTVPTAFGTTTSTAALAGVPPAEKAVRRHLAKSE